MVAGDGGNGGLVRGGGEERVSRGASKALCLVRLMELLRDRPYRAAELAERLGVHHRTVNRYLNDLAGAPLYYPVYFDGERWAHINAAREAT